MKTNWTRENPESYIHCVVAAFIDQIQDEIGDTGISIQDLSLATEIPVERLEGFLYEEEIMYNITFHEIAAICRELNLDISLVTYEANKKRSPIHPLIFYKCWKKCNCPEDNFYFMDEEEG